MGQRNMVYTGPMIDTEIEHARIQPEPCVIPYGQITSFPPPNNGILPPGNIHGPLPHGVAPPGARVVPVPISHVLHHQLPFPTNQFMDGFDSVFKRKIPEGFPVHFQYFYPAPGSGSFVGPEFRGNAVVPVVMAPGLHQGARTIATGAVGLDPRLQFIARPLPVVPADWLNQQFCGNAPGIPYMQGYINGYQVTPANGNAIGFVHPVPITSPPPLPPMLPLQGAAQNMDFHRQMTSPQLRLPLQHAVEPPRFVGPAPPFGFGVDHPHRQDLMIESTARPRGFPYFRVLPEDGVAILNLSNYGNHVDHHRDMRLDIDHMSYEELLALGEQIGSVGSGLSDEFIEEHLKITFAASKFSEDASSADQELNLCTICQTDYNDQEKIGVLDCSHEYHVGCIKKWLVEKNTCPICKSTALAVKEPGTDGGKAGPQP